MFMTINDAIFLVLEDYFPVLTFCLVGIGVTWFARFIISFLRYDTESPEEEPEEPDEDFGSRG